MSRVSGKPYFVYILWSPLGRRFYIGISEDPMLRVGQHNAPENTGWTARYRPWELVYREKHPDYTSARRRENELKAQKGGRGLFAKTGLDPLRFHRGS
jgi:putative endonuclease